MIFKSRLNFKFLKFNNILSQTYNIKYQFCNKNDK
jgi:hypothetical protein